MPDLEESIRRIFAPVRHRLYLLYDSSIYGDIIKNYYDEHTVDEYYFLQYESIAVTKGSPFSISVFSKN